MGEYPDLRDEKREEEVSKNQANISFDDLEDALCPESSGGKIQIRGTETVLERMEAEEYIEKRNIDYEIVDAFLSELVENIPDDQDTNVDVRESFERFEVPDPLVTIQEAATRAYETITRKSRRESDLDYSSGNAGLGFQFENNFRYREHREKEGDWRDGAVEFIGNLTTEENDGRLLKAVDLIAADQEFDESTVKAVSETQDEEYARLAYRIDDSKVSSDTLARYIQGVSDQVFWKENY